MTILNGNIVLDITEDKYLVASVFINSEINFKYINSQELAALQYYLDTESFNFLDHNSVVDCSKIFVEPYEKYKIVLLKNAVRKKGNLSNDEVDKICQLVRKSKNITIKDKKKFKRLFAEE
ncbi:MAG: hypothetical protein AB2L24_33170 [Mangrovibacterium sp.]